MFPISIFPETHTRPSAGVLSFLAAAVSWALTGAKLALIVNTHCRPVPRASETGKAVLRGLAVVMYQGS